MDNITWTNLFYLEKYSPIFTNFDLKNEFCKWVENIVREFYHNESRFIVSYGFIKSPKNSDISQHWHFDYGEKVSNLFIPLTETTINNSTQFVRGPLKSKMPESNYFPDPSIVMSMEEQSFMEICQVITKSFNILKII